MKTQAPLTPADSRGIPAPITRTPRPLSTPRPETVSMEKYKHDVLYVRRQISAERVRHASVEAVMTRFVANLEQQVTDLRELYMRSLSIKVGPHE